MFFTFAPPHFVMRVCVCVFNLLFRCNLALLCSNVYRERFSSVQFSFLVHKPSGSFFFSHIPEVSESQSVQSCFPFSNTIKAWMGSIPHAEGQSLPWHGACMWAMAQKREWAMPPPFPSNATLLWGQIL